MILAGDHIQKVVDHFVPIVRVLEVSKVVSPRNLMDLGGGGDLF